MIIIIAIVAKKRFPLPLLNLIQKWVNYETGLLLKCNMAAFVETIASAYTRRSYCALNAAANQILNLTHRFCLFVFCLLSSYQRIYVITRSSGCCFNCQLCEYSSSLSIWFFLVFDCEGVDFERNIPSVFIAKESENLPSHVTVIITFLLIWFSY